MVHNGPFKYPGAKSIKRKGSSADAFQRLHTLHNLNKLSEVKLEIGDIVNRHMLDGDIVLFNRQPSLHK